MGWHYVHCAPCMKEIYVPYTHCGDSADCLRTAFSSILFVFEHSSNTHIYAQYNLVLVLTVTIYTNP